MRTRRVKTKRSVKLVAVYREGKAHEQHVDGWVVHPSQRGALKKKVKQ